MRPWMSFYSNALAMASHSNIYLALHRLSGVGSQEAGRPGDVNTEASLARDSPLTNHGLGRILPLPFGVPRIHFEGNPSMKNRRKSLSELVSEQWHVYETDPAEMRRLARWFVIVMTALLLLSNAAHAQSSTPGTNNFESLGTWACAGVAVVGAYFDQPWAIDAAVYCEGVVATGVVASQSGQPQQSGPLPGDPYNSLGGAANCDPTIDPCYGGDGSPGTGKYDPAPIPDSPSDLARHSTGTRAQLTTEAQQQAFTARWQDALCKYFKAECSQ
jgi:hypothetical protein